MPKGTEILNGDEADSKVCNMDKAHVLSKFWNEVEGFDAEGISFISRPTLDQFFTYYLFVLGNDMTMWLNIGDK